MPNIHQTTRDICVVVVFYLAVLDFKETDQNLRTVRKRELREQQSIYWWENLLINAFISLIHIYMRKYNSFST